MFNIFKKKKLTQLKEPQSVAAKIRPEVQKIIDSIVPGKWMPSHEMESRKLINVNNKDVYIIFNSTFFSPFLYVRGQGFSMSLDEDKAIGKKAKEFFGICNDIARKEKDLSILKTIREMEL